MITAQVKKIWCSLVDDKFKGETEYYGAIIDKLKRLKFAYGKPRHSKQGTPRCSYYCIYCYTLKHFPSLLRLFVVKSQAEEIPARAKRTRLEHHSPKLDQLRLVGGNQMDLF